MYNTFSNMYSTAQKAPKIRCKTLYIWAVSVYLIRETVKLEWNFIMLREFTKYIRWCPGEV